MDNDDSITEVKEKLLKRVIQLDNDKIDELFNFIGYLMESGDVVINSVPGGFRFAYKSSIQKLNVETDFPKLQEFDVEDLLKITSELFSVIHHLEHDEIAPIKLVEDIEIEGKEDKIEEFVKTFKNQKIYSEMLFLIDRTGQQIDTFEGKLISAKIGSLDVQYYEIKIGYYDLNQDRKSIRLELTTSELKSLIDDLNSLIE